MTIEHASDLDGLQRIGALVALTLSSMREAAVAGLRTMDLDALGAEMLHKAGAQSAPKLTYGFPGATCISVNRVVAHGIPDDTVLCDGDLVNIDVSAELDGYFADTGGSFVVGAATEAQQRLLDATREARDTAIAQLRAGDLLNGIGRSIQAVAARRGFRIIRNHAKPWCRARAPRIPGFDSRLLRSP